MSEFKYEFRKSLELFFQKKRLMETSMGFLYQLLPFTFNVRKNDCFVCKLLIGFFFAQVQQTYKSDRMIGLKVRKKTW